MKIALYIEDGLEQIVLTPESPSEKAILGKLSDGTRELKIYSGQFYACQGGWTRWNDRSRFYDSSERATSDSAIIVLRPPAPPEPAAIEPVDAIDRRVA